MNSARQETRIEDCPAYTKHEQRIAYSQEINVGGKNMVFCSNCAAYHLSEQPAVNIS
jgi:hypothetical protein